jgi:hypothetical protein
MEREMIEIREMLDAMETTQRRAPNIEDVTYLATHRPRYTTFKPTFRLIFLTDTFLN